LRDELTDEEKKDWARREGYRKTVSRLKALNLRKREASSSASSELFGRIKAEYQTDYWRSTLWEASPASFDIEDPNNAGSLIESLFQPDDFVWSGGLYDSGKPHHSENFQTVEDLLKKSQQRERISGSTFKRGSYSRSESNVTKQRYILAESDDMSFAESACLLPLFNALSITTRAIVHTGGKSLHFWVDHSEETKRILKTSASALKLDVEALSRSTNPLRLPGCLHEKTNNPARLYYLNPISILKKQ